MVRIPTFEIAVGTPTMASSAEQGDVAIDDNLYKASPVATLWRPTAPIRRGS